MADPTTKSPPLNVKPVAGGERIDVLDALRGFALLGILLYNIDVFSGYTFLPSSERVALATSATDGTVEYAILLLMRGKFYSIFSFLFGVGFAIFMQRTVARGGDFPRLFRRRLTGLLVIGLVHTTLIWFGDILVLYALLGFLLIPLRHLSQRALLRTALVLLASPIVLYGLLLGVMGTSGGDASSAGMPPFLRDALAAFSAGSYMDVVPGHVAFTVAGLPRRLVEMQLFRVFGMMLLGFWAARAGIFAKIAEHRARWRAVAAVGLLIGLPLQAIAAGIHTHPVLPSTDGWLRACLDTVGVPALAAAYVALLTLAFERGSRESFEPLCAVGRTALTNYLLQSVLAIAVFYGIGGGLFGHVGIGYALLIAVGIYLLLAAATLGWLRHHRWGPMEWLWRRATYGRGMQAPAPRA